jgi:hypothetical protein
MLKLILSGCGLSLKMLYAIAGIMDKDFKKRRQERSISIVIKTLDGKTAMTYLLQGGKISVVGRDCPDPDVCIAWSSALDLYHMVLHLSPERMVKSFVDAIREGKLKIECKVEPLLWFSQTLTQMLGVYCDRSKPKKFLFINSHS